MSDTRKGYFIITQNNKKHDYIRMAYALALSIKITQTEVNNVSIALPGSDEHLVNDEQKRVFDEIVELPWGDDADGAEWKVNNKWKYIHCTPYNETVILDADMLFLNDYSYWWEILHRKPVWATSCVRTYRNEIVLSDYYRKTFQRNRLPNIYTAFMYFRNEKITWDLVKLVQEIMQNWEMYYAKHLDASRPTWLSADVAYALAIKILGIENECTGNLAIPSFVHMKTRVQNVNNALTDENWTKYFPSYFTDDCKLKIGNYQIFYPFHYHVKEWLTNDIVKKLEDAYGKSS